MVEKGALEIFKRSIDKRGLKYTQFVGDGYRDTFKIVHEEMEKLYGDRYRVQKKECVGHIQKRMGNVLRTWKKVSEYQTTKLWEKKTVLLKKG